MKTPRPLKPKFFTDATVGDSDGLKDIGFLAPDEPESRGNDPSTSPTLEPNAAASKLDSPALGGDSDSFESGEGPQSGVGAEPGTAEENYTIVAEFFPEEVANECPDATAKSTLAGAVEDFVPGSHTVSVKVYLGDEVVVSGDPDLDEDGHFVFPVEGLRVAGEYLAEVELFTDGEANAKVGEPLLTVLMGDCDDSADADFEARLSKNVTATVDTSCSDPNSNVRLGGHVDNLDMDVYFCRPGVATTVAGATPMLMVNKRGNFSGSLGFFSPGTYKAALQYRRLLHPERIVPVGMGDPVTVTFTVPDNGCSTPFSGDFTLIKDPGCVPAGQTAMVTLEGAFTAPGEHKNHRLVATIAGTKEKAVEVWRGSHPGLKRFMYAAKNRLSAGTYVVQLRMEYDSGPFFFYSWVFMDPYMYTEMTIPTCASGVGDAETPPSSQDQTAGTTTRADAAPTTSATGLAKTGVSVLPVFLVGAIALASGLALKMRRTREG